MTESLFPCAWEVNYVSTSSFIVLVTVDDDVVRLVVFKL